MNCYLGLDFGTSGARAVVIDLAGVILAEVQFPFGTAKDSVSVWKDALFSLLGSIPLDLRHRVRRIAINGTSSTVLLVDRTGTPITAPLMYNDNRGEEELTQVRAIAPPDSIALSATSSLAKLLWFFRQPFFSQATYFLHQADWLAFLLHGQLGISDYHNALKLGYDVHHLTYPLWLKNLPFFPLLPQILAPGTPVGEVTKSVGDRFHFPPDCLVCAGTTDSIAAFLASGARQPGEAVTSLGSTLVLKLLSEKPVVDLRSGVYSHRLGDLWLTGGASNTGGAILRHFFTDTELTELSYHINPHIPSPLVYYPLLQSGERFPINNPHLRPQLEPRPAEPVEFLYGLLESMARIEAQGYQRLLELGATPLKQVYTAGGGAKNHQWGIIRQRYLPCPVTPSHHTQAAYGTALLARG